MKVWIVISTDSGSEQSWVHGVYSSQSQADYATNEPEAKRYGSAYWEEWNVK